MDRVAVNVHVYHYSKMTLPSLPPVWSDDRAAKFNIFDAVSEAAHRMRDLDYKPLHARPAAATAAAAERTFTVDTHPRTA